MHTTKQRNQSTNQ